MFAVETYAAVRRFIFVGGKSQREAARVFGLSRETIAKMCRYSVPPGYVRTKEPEKPKLGPLVPFIDAVGIHLNRVCVGLTLLARFQVMKLQCLGDIAVVRQLTLKLILTINR